MTGARRIRIGPVHCGGAAPCGDVGWRKKRRQRPAPRRAHRRGAQGNGGETGEDGPRARTRRRRSRRAGRRRTGAGEGGGRSGGGWAPSGERHERTTNSAGASPRRVTDPADRDDASKHLHRAILRPCRTGKRFHNQREGRVRGDPCETPPTGFVGEDDAPAAGRRPRLRGGTNALRRSETPPGSLTARPGGLAGKRPVGAFGPLAAACARRARRIARRGRGKGRAAQAAADVDRSALAQPHPPVVGPTPDREVILSRRFSRKVFRSLWRRRHAAPAADVADSTAPGARQPPVNHERRTVARCERAYPSAIPCAPPPSGWG